MTTLDALDPAVGEPLGRLVEGVWDGRVDPSVLERCREVMCRRLGADPSTARPDHVAAGADETDDRERACLAFAEQWVLDPHGITDETAATLRSHLNDAECAAFTIALATVEARIRATVALGALT